MLFWGSAIPIAATVALAAGLILRNIGLAVACGWLLALPLAQFGRLALREARRRPLREAVTLATFLMLAKPAQAIGIGRYWLGRLRGRGSAIIEYKGELA